jgi:hypothetical protein
MEYHVEPLDDRDDDEIITTARNIYMPRLEDDLIITDGTTPDHDPEVDRVGGGTWVKAYLWVPRP